MTTYARIMERAEIMEAERRALAWTSHAFWRMSLDMWEALGQGDTRDYVIAYRRPRRTNDWAESASMLGHDIIVDETLPPNSLMLE